MGADGRGAREALAKRRRLFVICAAFGIVMAAVGFYTVTSRARDTAAAAKTLRRVKADAVPIHGRRWDEVRARSLLASSGGVADAFADVGPPYLATYDTDQMTLTFRVGDAGDHHCVTVKLRRESADATERRCA